MHNNSSSFAVEKDIVDDILESVNISSSPTFSSQSQVPRSVSSSGHINLTTFPIDQSAIQAVQSKVVLHYKFMPLELNGSTLKIAVSSLNNVTLFDDLRTFLGFEIMPFLAREDDIVAAINEHYGIGSETIEQICDIAVEQCDSDFDSTQSITEISTSKDDDAAIITFVNKIFFEAFKDNATDIHIEPYQERLRIRYRVDGELQRLNVPASLIHLKDAIISRIKIMGGLDIAERRLPQDGRLKVKVNNRLLDMRISTLPTMFGESINIRLLSSSIDHDLGALGFDDAHIAVIEKAIHQPHGIVLVSGPTGSGKTSTLYTCLHKLNRDHRKIITIEDPIEYHLEGITQMQTKSKIGFTFATGLRSILRHDPNIVMVGEIRDCETAEIAFRSSMTGHLVFSTVHTNSAAQTISRLLDIGLEPYLLADAMECVVAQRLVRVLCEECKEQVPISSAMRERFTQLYPDNVSGDTMYRAVGCHTCKHTGFKGRTVVYEVLLVDDGIKKLIYDRANADEIQALAVKKGMRTLVQSGIEKVTQGVSTYEEVMKVTKM